MFSIKQATEGDVGVLQSMNEVFKLPQYPSSSLWSSKNFIESSVEQGNAWIARLDGIGVGSVIMCHGDGVSWIKTISVDLKQRRKGIGRLLISTAIMLAKLKGHHTLGVVTGRAYDASPFYAQVGFHLVAETDLDLHFRMSLRS